MTNQHKDALKHASRTIRELRNELCELKDELTILKRATKKWWHFWKLRSDF